MPIIVKLDAVLKQRGIKSKDLALSVGISEVNMSRIRSQKIRSIRFSTLSGICQILECQPKDILIYVPESEQ